MILGAWGCGVFCNNLNDIANYFAHFLINEGKYSKCFDNIIFAVYSTEKKTGNISYFETICQINVVHHAHFEEYFISKKDNKIYTS